MLLAIVAALGLTMFAVWLRQRKALLPPPAASRPLTAVGVGG